MSVGHICSRAVVTAEPTETVRAAARRMAERDVGCVVVVPVNGATRPAGILTDRDVAVRCVAGDRHPDETLVSEVMTFPVQTVAASTSIEEALSHMAGAVTRRLVVTDDELNAIGILSVDDVLDHLVGETAEIGRLLQRQRAHVRV